MELSTKLSKVVVYKDRAQLFRDANITLQPGEHTLQVKGVWNQVDRDTLQVATKRGGDAALLRSVQFTTIHDVKDVRPERAAIDDELKPIQSEILTLTDKISVATATIAAYTAVQASFTKKNDQLEIATSTIDPEKTMQLMNMTMSGIRAAQSKKRGLEESLADLRDKESSLQRRRRQLGPQDQKRTSYDVAEVQLKVVKEADLHLVFSYIVRGPSWEPSYDLRVDSKTKKMEVVYNAIIHQASSEDWNDVKLELSTAKRFGASPPKAEPWTLKFWAPPPPPCPYGGLQLQRAPGGPPPPPQMMQQMMAPPQQMMMTNMMMAPELDEAPPEPEPASMRLNTTTAAVSQQSTSATYAIDFLNTIKCDNEPVRVTICQVEFSCYFRYSAVPKLSDHSYLKVKAVNSTPFTFLPGKTNIFADNQFVCNSEMALVAPGEDFWTFVGVDDTMSVERTSLGQKEAKAEGWMSKTKSINYRYKFTAKNKKKDTQEEIVIWDQLPVIEDSKIHFKLQAPKTKAGEPDSGKPDADPKYMVDKDQFIEWILELQPGQERTFFLDYVIEHPADEVLLK